MGSCVLRMQYTHAASESTIGIGNGLRGESGQLGFIYDKSGHEAGDKKTDIGGERRISMSVAQQ